MLYQPAFLQVVPEVQAAPSPPKNTPKNTENKTWRGKITSISDWLHSGLMLPLVLLHQEVPGHPVDDSDNHFDHVWEYSWLFSPH